MYDRIPSPELWRMNTQQHVSLEKHERMIQDALDWQKAPDHAENDRNVVVKTLRARLADVLHFMMRHRRMKDARNRKRSSSDLNINCLDSP